MTHLTKIPLINSLYANFNLGTATISFDQRVKVLSLQMELLHVGIGHRPISQPHLLEMGRVGTIHPKRALARFSGEEERRHVGGSIGKTSPSVGFSAYLLKVSKSLSSSKPSVDYFIYGNGKKVNENNATATQNTRYAKFTNVSSLRSVATWQLLR